MLGNNLKSRVRAFWDARSCGEVYAAGQTDLEYFDTHRAARYRLEPYIIGFARFADAAGKDLLEIGVGMGADHIEWARANPRFLAGIDLTPRAVDYTRRRLAVYDLKSDVRVADAENLPFDDGRFDIVYSWGVLHHSPDTGKGFSEVHRVLRPGGIARVMIYHKYSLTGYMLWTRYALLRGRLWLSLDDIYARYLESPGTKAYTRSEASKLVAAFSQVRMTVHLSFGDLLEGQAGQRHGGLLLQSARAIWPRAILRKYFARHGLMLLIEATK